MMNNKTAWIISIMGCIMVVAALGLLVYEDQAMKTNEVMGKVQSPFPEYMKWIMIVIGIGGSVLLAFCPWLQEKTVIKAEVKDEMKDEMKDEVKNE